MTGDVYVVSGPSGAGKGSLLERVIPQLDNIWLSVSATTRLPRVGETDGVHYFFKGNEEFDRLIATDGLLEWAFVHSERYGTMRCEVEDRLARGIDVILEIDPQGAFQVLRRVENAILVFIEAPSMEELIKRLRIRGTEDEAAINKRMRDSAEILKHRDQYHHIIVNDDFEKAAEELLELFKKQRKTHVFDATTHQ